MHYMCDTGELLGTKLSSGPKVRSILVHSWEVGVSNVVPTGGFPMMCECRGILSFFLDGFRWFAQLQRQLTFKQSTPISTRPFVKERTQNFEGLEGDA